ncbi:MAG: DUF2341 domain-containing protein [Candidatus Eisenbacteria bacterium]
MILIPPQALAQGWYDSSWANRKPITIQGSEVGVTGAPHANFPVLVSITDSDLQSMAQADGDDILFTADDGTTKLSHEIEGYTSGTGTLVAWVEVPSLASGTNTTLYMYYGNASVGSQADGTGGTWSEGFEGVWHLNGVFTDSSPNGRDGTNHGTNATTGVIAGGRALSGANPDNISITGLMGSPTSLTISGWVDLTATDSNGSEFLSMGDCSLLRCDNLGFQTDGMYYHGAGWYGTGSGVNLVGTSWRYVAYTCDDVADTQNIFIDGVPTGGSTYAATPIYTGLGTDTWIGAHGNGDGNFDLTGNVDEVRVASVARSAGWILTEYNNQSAPGAFLTSGTEEYLVTGTVFEDANYGGGVGRSLAGSSGTGQSGARVEIYDGSGVFAGATTTDGTGVYGLGAATGDHTIRVVSITVTSSRTGWVSGIVPVQTFRTDASSGTASPVTDYVGGQDPSTADAGNGSSGATMNTSTGVFTAGITGTAQSIAPVTVGTANVTGVDFGFNFNTIVNVNDSGQGSLRQFLQNSSALSNVGLAIDGQTAGEDVSLFMITDGLAHAGLRSGLTNQLTSGVALITPNSALDYITDDNTVIDGTTQTLNIGDTNSGQLGTGGTVGTDALALGQVDAPEVEIRGDGFLSYGLRVEGNDVTIRGLAIVGWGSAVGESCIHVADTFTGVLIEENLLGTTALAFADPGAALRSRNGMYSDGADSGTFRNNLVGWTDVDGLYFANASSGWSVSGNELRDCGITGSNGDGMALNNVSDLTFTGNLFVGASSQAIVFTLNTNCWFENNTITGSGVGITTGVSQSTAICARGGAGSTTFYRNLVEANYGAAFQMNDGSTGITLTENSCVDNGTIVARDGSPATGQIGIDLNSATDDPNMGTAPFVTINDTLDVDTGGNGLLNFPVIEHVLKAGTTVSVRGFVHPGAALEFFISDGDATGFGEGERFLFSSVEGSGNDLDSSTGAYGPGAINGLVQGSDAANKFIVSGAAPAWLTTADLITATATDASGNTSEFSGVAAIDQHTIVKRTFSESGTALTSGASAPRGAIVRFLLYVNNWGGAFTDLSVEDILDPGFEYVPGTIRIDNSVSACSVDGCTTPDEAAIYASVAAQSPGTDAVDGDGVSYTGGSQRIDAGNQNVANAQVNVSADRVWAILFDVRIR